MLNGSASRLAKGVATMPIYTCTIAESTLCADTKHALAGEIAHIHSSINHVPSTYVNVAFHELAAHGAETGPREWWQRAFNDDAMTTLHDTKGLAGRWPSSRKPSTR
jgi:phenylpyruvate tautomerase PptA (4-oxalocrotonate tautomerase family)